jgi:transposase InsO family protein
MADCRHGYPIAPNRLGRNVTTQTPNQIWLADLTYIAAGEGWPYLAAVLDLHTRKIVGWSMRPTLHVEGALDALNMAIERQRPAPGLIHHSDRGIHYAAEAYRSAPARAGITPSMSRKGDRRDNAPMESFFHTLKTERVHHRATPRATRPGAICSATSRASTISAACTPPWATSAQPTPSVERLNPVHFFGGRSLHPSVPFLGRTLAIPGGVSGVRSRTAPHHRQRPHSSHPRHPSPTDGPLITFCSILRRLKTQIS